MHDLISQTGWPGTGGMVKLSIRIMVVTVVTFARASRDSAIMALALGDSFGEFGGIVEVFEEVKQLCGGIEERSDRWIFEVMTYDPMSCTYKVQ
jgi:hypothetical protein